MTCTVRFTILMGALAAAAALPATSARAESGVFCSFSTFQPPLGSTIPANLPGLVVSLSSPSFNLADAQLDLTDGSGTPVPFTAEGAGPRYVLRLTGPLKLGTLRLAHSVPCGPNRFREAATWTVGPAARFPRNLGTITVGPPRVLRGFPDRAYLALTVNPDPDFVPFAGTARYTLTARRAGAVFWEWKDQPIVSAPWNLGDVSFECATAADSGEREIEVRALVAGASDSEQAGLVARANFTVSCPRSIPGDGGAPIDPFDDGGTGNAGPPDTAPPVTTPPDAGVDAPQAVIPPPADASADAPAVGTTSGGCTVATATSVPWWAALVALAALLRLRRARR